MRLAAGIRVIGPALVVAVVWFALSTRVGGQVADVTEDAEAINRQATARQRAAAGLQDFTGAAPETEAAPALDRLSAAIPAGADVPQLIELVATVGHTASVRVETISPNPTPQALSNDPAMVDPAVGTGLGLSRIEVNVRGTGSYEATMAYLDLLSQAERLLVIRSIELAAEDTAGTVRFAADLDAFAADAATGLSVAASPSPTPPIAFEEE